MLNKEDKTEDYKNKKKDLFRLSPLFFGGNIQKISLNEYSENEIRNMKIKEDIYSESYHF